MNSENILQIMSSHMLSLKQVNGCIFPAICPDESIAYALNYKPSNDDIFVATYPRCGTTWTQQIVALLYAEGIQKDVDPFNYSYISCLELRGQETVVTPTVKTHLPYGLLPMNKSAKYVLVFRNPKDQVVSYYHFLKHAPGYKEMADIHAFFPEWMAGHVPCGDYFPHTLDYWTHRIDANILYLVYEQMIRNPKEAVLRIAYFLGGNDFVDKVMANNETILGRVLNYSRSDYMQGMGGMGKALIRKAIVGDWRSQLSREESDLIDAKFGQYFAGSELQDIWREDMKWL